MPNDLCTCIAGEVPPQPIEYSVQHTSDCVQITCYFKQHTSPNDCLVVVHQHLTQINITSGLMTIEVNRTQRFTRHDDIASGCVPGLDLEVYQIGVANGREVPGIHVHEYYILGGCVHTSTMHIHLVLYNFYFTCIND